ncbi:MAG: ABC transporter substrate-binding protein [Deltaproteobacteria bacterium]|nr:ABC transporter substrate-binding protein [Deltaproteobacteria bacterium]
MKLLYRIGFSIVCFMLLYLPASHARHIVDMMGRTVEVPVKIERVASPYRIATEMIITLGAQDKLVGVSTVPGDIIKHYFPDITNLSLADRHSSVEEFLRMKPDVIFTTYSPVVDKLAQSGISVFCMKVENPDSMLEGMLMIGDVLNKTEQAQNFARYFKAKLDHIEAMTKAITPKKAVYVVGPKILITVGGDFYQNFIVQYAGGINVARDLRGGWVPVSREHLIAWDPDVFITIGYTAMDPSQIKNDAGLAPLKALKTNAIYIFPSYIDSWDMPTPESLLAIMWLANILYPEKVNFDMHKEAREFYLKFYGSYPQEVRLN